MASRTDDEILIRKYRKKLRQIERLELLDRDLTEDEELKIDSKYEVRTALQEILSCRGDEITVEPAWTQQARNATNISVDSAIGDQMNTSDNGLEPEDGSNDEEESNVEDDEYADDDDNAEESRDQMQTSEEPAISEPPLKENNQSSSQEPPRPKRDASAAKEIKSVPAKKAKTEETHAPKTKAKESKQQTHTNLWRKAKFSVTGLEGHSDLISSISVYNNYLLTGSRDTTIKLWNLKTLLEIRNFGGHTGGVNKVLLLAPDTSKSLVDSLNSDSSVDAVSSVQIAISGAQDCSIKLWDIHSGKALRSVYVFSPVTCLTTLQIPHMVIVYTTNGGKLELWDPKSETVVQSLQCHEGKITGLFVEGKYVYTSGQDGYVKVHEVRVTSLSTVYESESTAGIRGATVQIRPIECMGAHNTVVYFGDEGTNVKALDWSKGELHKLSNHTIEFGSTNAICISNDLMLSSGYDFDNGIGYVNVRHLPSEKYLCSLCDEDTTRIMCLACTVIDNRHALVTGGMELVVWKQISSNYPIDDDQYVLESQYIPTFDRNARNSDVETEGETSDSESEAPADVPSFPRRRPSVSSDQNGGWLSRCSIL